MKLAIELLDSDGYGAVHKAGCRDLRDPEPVGDADTIAAATELVLDKTGWEPPYHFAPCTKGLTA